LGATVTNPFGQINPNLQISTIRAHQTLIQMLHALNEFKHQNASFPRDSMTEIIQKLPLRRSAQAGIYQGALQCSPVHCQGALQCT
ncbi:hypothetical protein MMT16_27700, partial [Escherichia coli]|nr:hypothetical protein [Escherichia coli]